jgi:hypothetical protein
MTAQQPKTKHLRLFDGASWLLQRVSVPKSQRRQFGLSSQAGAACFTQNWQPTFTQN